MWKKFLINVQSIILLKIFTECRNKPQHHKYFQTINIFPFSNRFSDRNCQCRPQLSRSNWKQYKNLIPILIKFNDSLHSASASNGLLARNTPIMSFTLSRARKFCRRSSHERLSKLKSPTKQHGMFSFCSLFPRVGVVLSNLSATFPHSKNLLFVCSQTLLLKKIFDFLFER